MQIEEGKRYVARNGLITPPAKAQPHSAQWPWHIEGFGSYTNAGRFNGEFDDPKDIIALADETAVTTHAEMLEQDNLLWTNERRGRILALMGKAREAALREAQQKIQDECGPCAGSGHAPDSTPDDPRQCEYCGRPMSAVALLINNTI